MKCCDHDQYFDHIVSFKIIWRFYSTPLYILDVKISFFKESQKQFLILNRFV